MARANPVVKVNGVFDANSDGVFDRVSALSAWNGEDVFAGEVVVSDGFTGAALTRWSSPGVDSWAWQAMPWRDVDGDGDVDFLVSSPLAFGVPSSGTQVSGFGLIQVVSYPDGHVLQQAVGTGDTLLGAKMEVVSDANADGVFDLAAVLLQEEGNGNVVARWSVLSGTDFSHVRYLGGPFKLGETTDVNQDGVINELDLIGVVDGVFLDPVDQWKFDVTGDDIVDVADVQAVVLQYGQASAGVPINGGVSNAVALPSTLSLRSRLLTRWSMFGLRPSEVTSATIYADSADRVSLATGQCEPRFTFQAMAPVCSEEACKWSGDIDFTFWLWIMFGTGTLNVSANGVDSTNCLYTVKGKARFARVAGSGGGYFSGSVSFSEYPAACMWPVNVGSRAEGKIVGLNAFASVPEVPDYIPLPTSANWMQGIAGAFRKTNVLPISGSGVNLYIGGVGGNGSFYKVDQNQRPAPLNTQPCPAPIAP